MYARAELVCCLQRPEVPKQEPKISKFASSNAACGPTLLNFHTFGVLSAVTLNLGHM